jgi:phage tail sheath protein FI
MDSRLLRADNAPMPVDTDATAEISTVGTLPLAERRITALECSIAGFAGLAPGGPLDRPVRVDSFEAFAAAFGDPAAPRQGPFLAGATLAHAVRGFFRNGGRACWVARVDGLPGSATVGGHLGPGSGLRLLEPLDEPTVIGVPDAHVVATGDEGVAAIQRELVTSCERVVGRIALVDPPSGLDPQGALDWRSRSRIDSPAAAAYYPWVEVSDPACGATVAVPPCGHVAGMWARVDGRAGPHRAPTAETLLATDAATLGLTGAQQHHLNRAGLNCLRGWPGPELRAWGACTLSTDPELRYLHRQRTVGHLVASIAQGTRWAADERNDDRLHESLRATVTAFLSEAWRQGALLGDTAAQAFFVRCDSGLNDARALAREEVVLEVGLAVRRPGNFRVLRISHHGAGA